MKWRKENQQILRWTVKLNYQFRLNCEALTLVLTSLIPYQTELANLASNMNSPHPGELERLRHEAYRLDQVDSFTRRWR